MKNIIISILILIIACSSNVNNHCILQKKNIDFLSESKNIDFLVSENYDTIPFVYKYLKDSIISNRRADIKFYIIYSGLNDKMYSGLEIRNDTIFQYFFNKEFDTIVPFIRFNNLDNTNSNLFGNYNLICDAKIESYTIRNSVVESYNIIVFPPLIDAEFEYFLDKFSISIKKGIYDIEVIDKNGVVYKQPASLNR